MSLIIKIKYHNENLTKIEKIDIGDWIDLRVAEDVMMRPFEYRLISLGIAMELPKGYESHIVPRSSTFKRYRIILANSFGIIDNSYNGDSDIWKFPALTLSKSTYIPFNSRICQFRIVEKQPNIVFKTVDNLNNENRGGFGSTGTNEMI